MFMISPFDIFATAKTEEKTEAKPSTTLRGYNGELNPNAGNFQEYTYELEWMECDWKIVYKTADLVTAFWYPWIRYPSSN
jgi:hypothetical protein